MDEGEPATEETDVPDIQPGLMLTHYRLVEKLGEGGMGVVWKAFDTRLNRHVALKLLRSELTSDHERQRRFMREARAVAAVSHPNIVTIYEVDESGGSSFLCMELVEGRTLRAAILDSRPLSLQEVLEITSEVAVGLARAHREGIIHRDLKPENIILGSDGHPKILDFGLAKLIESRQDNFPQGLNTEETQSADLTVTGMILGTAAYMSPEQVRGEVVDFRSDIFSFGVLLYELVTRQRPFHGSSQAATLAAILHEPAVPVSRLNANVPSRLEEVVSKCLDKDPRARYQSTEDLAVDLRRLRRELESARPSAYQAGGATSTEKRPSIAVLPFLNMSTESAHSFFAGGLHDELLTQLAKVAGLKVISRTSVMGYKETVKPLKVIAQELGVATIVEGSVQVMGERLRVNVQLIDAATDEHLWAERYDRTMDDAFAIQSDMAQQVVASVGAVLRAEERRAMTAPPTENPEAYQVYLQGEAYRHRPGYQRSDMELACQFFERALALDPGFALAHAALSQVHGALYWWRFDPSPHRRTLQRAEAEKALQLAPGLAQAHLALGLAHYWGEEDYAKALQEIEIARQSLPNDGELWQMIGAVNRRLGNWEDALLAFDTATYLNPRFADLFGEISWTLSFLRRYPEAVHALDRSLAITPGPWATMKGRICLSWKGELETIQSLLDSLPLDAHLGMVWTMGWARADVLLLQRRPDDLLDLVRDAPSPVLIAQMFYIPTSLYAAWAHDLRGDVAAARKAYGAALELLDSAMSELSHDWRVHQARGVALGGLGRSNDAQGEVEWLRSCRHYRFDAFDRPEIALRCAMILASIGKNDEAIREIEANLAGPGDFSVHYLRLDPRWDPLRHDPKFKELLVRYSDPEQR